MLSIEIRMKQININENITSKKHFLKLKLSKRRLITITIIKALLLLKLLVLANQQFFKKQK